MPFIYLFMIVLAVVLLLTVMNHRRNNPPNDAYDPFKNSGSTSGEHTRLPAGKYDVGEDIEAGKYDFILVSGEGWLKYRLPNETEYLVEIEFGFARSELATQYRNLSCETGGQLKITGSAVLEIRKSMKTIVK